MAVPFRACVVAVLALTVLAVAPNAQAWTSGTRSGWGVQTGNGCTAVGPACVDAPCVTTGTMVVTIDAEGDRLTARWTPDTTGGAPVPGSSSCVLTTGHYLLSLHCAESEAGIECAYADYRARSQLTIGAQGEFTFVYDHAYYDEASSEVRGVLDV